jgi:hypothetical protein
MYCFCESFIKSAKEVMLLKISELNLVDEAYKLDFKKMLLIQFKKY